MNNTVISFDKPSEPSVAVAQYKVPTASEEKLELFVRERRPQNLDHVAGVVLFVHGASLPSILFDIPIEGRSWLSYCAARQWRAFAVDIRGYGRSDKPSAMDGEPMAAPPVAQLEEAVADIEAAVRFILKETGVEKLCLVGGSWGSVTSAVFAARHGQLVDRLALYAPLYSDRNDAWLDLITDPTARNRINPNLGAYRRITEQKLRQRWKADIAHSNAERAVPEEVFQSIWRDCLAADDSPAGGAPPAFRAPNGTLVDLFSVFTNTPLYEPALITCPTLLMRGTDDATSTRDDALGLFELLGAEDKRYIEISNAGHFASAEKRAYDVFGGVQAFLESTNVEAAE